MAKSNVQESLACLRARFFPRVPKKKINFRSGSVFKRVASRVGPKAPECSQDISIKRIPIVLDVDFVLRRASHKKANENAFCQLHCACWHLGKEAT